MDLGSLRLKRRTWVPAMVPWRATEDGFVTQANLDWYGRFARGRPGVLVLEATGIRDIPSGPLLRISHERFIPGLSRIVQRVREESGGETRLLIQILDFLRIRRRPEPSVYFERFFELRPEHRRRLEALAPEVAALPEGELRRWLAVQGQDLLAGVLDPREFQDLVYGARESVNDLHLPWIRDLPRALPSLFAQAAARAKEAGFDGVELHYAHAYTMAQFLSRTNERDDGYGGSPEARLRLPLEVIAAVRAAVGEDYCLGCRMLGDEVIPGGSRIEDASGYAEAFARAGLDFLSISKGGKFEDAKPPRVGEAAYPYTGPSGHECMPTTRIGPPGPWSRNVPLAAQIRARVRAAGFTTPVVTAGGIASFTQAETILQKGHADLIASARQSLADPDWFLKMEQGRGSEIRRCTFTNYCEGLDRRHKEVTCKLWDRLFTPGDPIPLSKDKKRRLLPP